MLEILNDIKLDDLVMIRDGPFGHITEIRDKTYIIRTEPLLEYREVYREELITYDQVIESMHKTATRYRRLGYL